MKSIVEFKEIHGNNYPSIQTLISSTEDEYKLKIIDYLKKADILQRAHRELQIL